MTYIDEQLAVKKMNDPQMSEEHQLYHVGAKLARENGYESKGTVLHEADGRFAKLMRSREIFVKDKKVGVAEIEHRHVITMPATTNPEDQDFALATQNTSVEEAA